MLSFSGTVFQKSLILIQQYEAFLDIKNKTPFLRIDSDCCKKDIRIGFKDAENEKKIKNVVFSFSKAEAACTVQCYEYRLLVSDCFSNIVTHADYLSSLDTKSYIRFNEAIHQAARFRALFLNMLVLHASAIVYRDEGILFSGVSGAGKSTQARLWLENTDSWVLNYDKPVVKLDGERVLVSGSPWGGKEDLAINEVRPAKALFFVHQAKENRVVRLSAAQAYAQAHLNYFVYPLNEDIENRYNDAIIQLVKKVPIYDLYCTDTADAVTAVKRVLYPEEE